MREPNIQAKRVYLGGEIAAETKLFEDVQDDVWDEAGNPNLEERPSRIGCGALERDSANQKPEGDDQRHAGWIDQDAERIPYPVIFEAGLDAQSQIGDGGGNG